MVEKREQTINALSRDCFELSPRLEENENLKFNAIQLQFKFPPRIFVPCGQRHLKFQFSSTLIPFLARSLLANSPYPISPYLSFLESTPTTILHLSRTRISSRIISEPLLMMHQRPSCVRHGRKIKRKERK